jgi:formylglycine-generating enzyme required for sulfatase activity
VRSAIRKAAGSCAAAGLALVVPVLSLGGTGCQEDLPPFGEVVIHVDTDLPVPALAARLRVDVFAEDGSWLSTRDHALARPSDWPVSFSVLSRDEQTPREVLVRLRVYPEGKVRDYLGERYAERPTFAESYARNEAELCAAPPELVLGQEITLRRGQDYVTGSGPTAACPNPAQSGAVAARVVITEPAEYRFAVLRDTYGQSVLFLRTTCADAASEVICASNPGYTSPQPDFTVSLEPGAYTLLATSRYDFAPSDVTLRAARADQWAQQVPVPASPVPIVVPRLVSDGVDLTPQTEPLPRLAVDRLVRIGIEPGRVRAARVVLRGSCAGTMSRLAADVVVQQASVAEATTCVEVENERGPVALEPLDDDVDTAGASLQGTFGRGEPCDGQDTAGEVCVPGAPFVLGGPYGAVWDVSTLPERVAVMSRFWIDRNEVTVGRFRAALAAGHQPVALPVERSSDNPFCTFTPEPGDREDHPLGCVPWRDARAFCQWAGGDLPTEPQWEYVASSAGRALEARYPWGDELPTCDVTVVARNVAAGSECAHQGLGPQPVGTRAQTDVTALGVVNLGGSVHEWTRDSAYDFDHPCWDSQPLRDPSCFEESAPRHVVRGGSWYLFIQYTQTTQRLPVRGRYGYAHSGFRCVYPGPPP